jgi:uncharacterized protein
MVNALAFASRPYRLPATAFHVVTEDGLRLAGHRVDHPAHSDDPQPTAARTAVVFCHGFLGWHRKPRLVAFQEALARHLTVYAFDFRGHGQSEGLSTFGVEEVHDIEAVVRLARAEGFDRVVTLGGSMGGAAVIRHGGLCGGVDAVVSVSAPARWDGHDSEAVRRMVWLTATPTGRRILRAGGVRIAHTWRRAEDPADLIGRISPVPVVIVHGRDDHYFDEEEAWLLYRRAGRPKRLLLADRFGHAEDGYGAALADRLARIVLTRAADETTLLTVPAVSPALG